MERYCRDGKMSWAMIMIYGASFLRFVLSDFGYALDEGIVLVVDSEAQSRRFIKKYCEATNGNGCQTLTWNGRSKVQNNYGVMFMQLKRTHKEDAVEEFLAQETFLPVIIAGGVLPDYLRTDRYILRLTKEDMEAVSGAEFAEEIKKFRNFLTLKVTDVCKVLERVKRSLFAEDYNGDKLDFFTTCLAIGMVYAEYLRETEPERKITDFLSDYVIETRERIRLMSEFASGEELVERLSGLVWGYFEENPEVVLADREAVDGTAYQDLKADSAVLFDEAYYYFPVNLLTRICEPLLQTCSMPQLKRQLREESIIHCNSADYTVKKEVVLVYGVKETQRFIWVYKDKLLSPDNLRLEDVFANDENDEGGRSYEVCWGNY